MPRSGKGLAIAGVALAAIGIIGLVVVGAGLLPTGTTGAGPFTSDGERIFFTGVGHDGPLTIVWDPPEGGRGMMRRQRGRMRASMGCAMCHRTDGRGGPVGMMSGIVAPDIRYATLTSAHGDEKAWSEAEIVRAIRTGEEPDGETLDGMMPRWEMDATDMRAIIAYLKELD